MAQLLEGKTIEEDLKILENFTSMMQSKGADKGDESLLEDGVALAGVAKFPARIKCALLGWMAFKDALAQSIEKENLN
jgi:nitrogen fixation NifU-like protein